MNHEKQLTTNKMQTQNKKSKTAPFSRFLSAKRLSVVSCPTSRGFTLIELLVSIAIFTIMTGVVLARYRTFDKNAMFANASEDVVLALRQAQVYGVGVKGQASFFDMPYGVHFSSGESGISIFADVNDNRVYDDTDTVVENVLWKSNISVSEIACDSSSCDNSVSITFKRPSPDAFITDIGGAFPSDDSVSIELKDANTEKTATVTITKAGQISVR